jgi:hypothetical protein
MPDYKNGKIYSIRCFDDPPLIYVGSTSQTLSQRWTDHKKIINNSKKNHICLYQKINELGVDKYYIELYEECPSENKAQLHKREGEIMRLIGTLNHRIAGRTKKENYQENQEHHLKKQKEYYQENKEKVIE